MSWVGYTNPVPRPVTRAKRPVPPHHDQATSWPQAAAISSREARERARWERRGADGETGNHRLRMIQDVRGIDSERQGLALGDPERLLDISIQTHILIIQNEMSE